MAYELIAKVNPPIENGCFVFGLDDCAYSIVAEITPSVTMGLFDFNSIGVAVDSLLNPPSVVLAEYLRQESLMTDPADKTDWPLYISYMPDVKTKIGSIYDTTNLKLGRHMNGEVIQEYGIQIKICSDVFNDGWAKIEALSLRLDIIKNEGISVNSEEYVIRFVSRSGPPIYIGVEDGTKKRKLFVLNCLINLCRI